MLPPLPRCSGWAWSSLISPNRVSLPRKGRRVGLHIVLFEACSAFTRVAACTLARSPYFVTRYPKASDISSPPCLLRLLPAGAVAGWDLHPLESAALSRRTPQADMPGVMTITPAVPDRPHWWNARFAHLAFWRPALRVLCYHQVHPGGPNRFTVTPQQLDQQLGYLVGAGFHFIHARDLLSGNSLPERPLLLTFDDGYLDNLEHAQPVLQRHGAKATIFIVTAYAGDRAQWNTDVAPLLSPWQLHELDAKLIELAF